MATQTYFHCAGAILEAGSVIGPGNWGRMLRMYEQAPNQGLPTNHFREALLELARQVHAPTKPSRLNALFAVPSLPEAVAFRNKYQRTNLIYEVVPTVDRPGIHFGDYELAIANYPPRYFQSMMDQARDYWAVAPTQNIEVLLDCSVRVVAQRQG
jgi:hypothetical protein